MQYSISGTDSENQNNRIMCLYTKYITNPKYLPNKKNNYKPPACKDRRLLYVPVKCGKCMECRKQNQSQWIVRLSEEIRKNPDKATFWTLTISNEEYEKLKSDSKKKDRDSICKLAVKRMLERITSARTGQHRPRKPRPA